jgi:hypothetical protein
MEHDRVMEALHAGQLLEAVVTPGDHSDGWVLFLLSPSGEQVAYTTVAGVPKVFHTLDRATEVARELGFESIRVEERF